ncbi:hypothetical protein AB0C04_19810 [Micromonospora sp. NPDC048909]|uniref:hypothetical protein n=1 Tax=Micromonospora sp. NPDC048909 TaxID=3155643 RepID=UPI0033DCE89E
MDAPDDTAALARIERKLALLRGLVATVLGPGVRDERLRRGRNAGGYADNWRRLLIDAGLSD